MRRRIILVAWNIRSLWNIGALFRSADCFAVEKVVLAGYTACPPRREISKTALGAEEWISWEQCSDPEEAMRALAADHWRIIALEQTPRSVPIGDYAPPEKCCLIVGHEILGVSGRMLSLCNDVVAIPMHGRKHSLNVSVAAGIALEHLRSAL